MNNRGHSQSPGLLPSHWLLSQFYIETSEAWLGLCHRPEPWPVTAIRTASTTLCPLYLVIPGVPGTKQAENKVGDPLVCSSPSREAAAQGVGLSPEVRERSRHRREQNTEFMNFE